MSTNIYHIIPTLNFLEGNKSKMEVLFYSRKETCAGNNNKTCNDPDVFSVNSVYVPTVLFHSGKDKKMYYGTDTCVTRY